MSAAVHTGAPPSVSGAAWAAAESLPLRACYLCDHGAEVDGQRCCACPALTFGGAPQPISLVRKRHGGCGPDALHMQAAWLKP